MPVAPVPREYRSARTWKGVPLVHVALGGRDVDGRHRVGRARGVVAVGGVAVGVIAVGGVAVGLVSVGGVSVGLVAAVGGVAVAAAAVGVVSVAVLAVGMVSIGVIAVGVVGIGVLTTAVSPATAAAVWTGTTGPAPADRPGGAHDRYGRTRAPWPG